MRNSNDQRSRYSKIVFRLLLILSVPAIIWACYGTIHIEQQNEAIQPTHASIEQGKILYAKHCVRCHGETGKGEGPDVDTLAKKPKDLAESGIHISTFGLESIIDYPHLSLETISKAVRHEDKTMKLQKEAFTPADIENLRNFLSQTIFNDKTK